MRRLATFALTFAATVASGTAVVMSTTTAEPVVRPATTVTSNSPAATSPAATNPAAASGVVDCGTFTYGQGEERDPTSARCIVDAAHAGRVARLVETSLTAEGDPIITKFVTNERGRLGVLTDTRRESFGPATLSLQTYRTSEARGSAVVVRDRIGHAQLWPVVAERHWFREIGILQPLEEERDCGFREVLIDRPDLAGLPVADVEKSERKAGRSIRLIGQDGTCFGGTLDFRSNRTNVYVDKGLVKWAEMA